MRTPTCSLVCTSIIKPATVILSGVVLLGNLAGCATKEPEIERTYIVRENYTLTTKTVTPLNNGISRAASLKQPVLVELNRNDNPAPVAKPVQGNTVRWEVYEKPYPMPSYTEGIAGSGMRDGIVETVFFPKNSAEANDTAALKILAEKLTMISGSVTLLGYTDTKERRENPGLGKERAQAVAEELERLGVPADRISVKNGGATKVYAGPDKDRCVNIVLKVR